MRCFHVSFIRIIAIILFFGLCSVSAQSKVEILTNKSIIDLVRAGLSKSLIVSKIESSTCKFDVSTSGIIDLKKQGVGDDLMKVMMDKTEGKAISVATENTSTTANDKNAISTANVSSVTMLNYVYQYKSGNVKPLEKAVVGIRTKQGMFSGSVLLHVDGVSSSFRSTPTDASSFVISTGSAILPELTLYKVKSNKKGREVAGMKVSSFSGMKTGEDVISLNITKLKEGVFQLTPGKTLEKGEYFFAAKPSTGATSGDGFCFGID